MDRREILNELQQIVALTKPTPADQDSWGSPEAAARAKGLIREVESWPTAFPPAPMDRREILNELQQIVALTDFLSERQQTVVPSVPEAAQRAKGLIREVESWPIAFPPAPFVSDQCAERHHGECQLGSANQPFSKLCHCACHCPPEAPQQPQVDNSQCCEYPTPCGCRIAAEAPQQPAEPEPATARHIDTPDELLELLAGVSSDPQVEGLSLSQKASTMALLYAAKALQQIADSQGHFDSGEIADAILIACGNLHEDSPQEPS